MPNASGPGGAGERDVAQRVTREHLAAQHDEVADESGQGRDRNAREERVLHEVAREQVANGAADR